MAAVRTNFVTYVAKMRLMELQWVRLPPCL
jgi:hypothetical protein